MLNHYVPVGFTTMGNDRIYRLNRGYLSLSLI